MNLRTLHRWVRGGFITFAITSTAFLIWGVQARGVPPAMFESDDRIRVEDTAYGRLFTPEGASRAGVVFLPGGLVDPDAYVPLMYGLASAGMGAALVDLPRRGAIPTSSTGRALAASIDEAVAGFGARRTVLAGHSRGGMFASLVVADNPALVDGLVLIGTTHPRDRDLSQLALPILKILGSEDCVASVAGARANAAMLPPATRWVEIAGANHRQFAYYSWQLGDCAASISRVEQHRQTIAVMAQFIDALVNPGQ